MNAQSLSWPFTYAETVDEFKTNKLKCGKTVSKKIIHYNFDVKLRHLPKTAFSGLVHEPQSIF